MWQAVASARVRRAGASEAPREEKAACGACDRLRIF